MKNHCTKNLKFLSIKDILYIQNNATDYYNSFPIGSKLEEMNRVLTEGEILSLSYLHSIIQFLKYKDLIDKDLDGNVILTQANSKTGG